MMICLILMVVAQITYLTNVSDKERLLLLKEVAGTQVYEQKRLESNRIMEETGSGLRKRPGYILTI